MHPAWQKLVDGTTFLLAELLVAPLQTGMCKQRVQGLTVMFSCSLCLPKYGYQKESKVWSCYVDCLLQKAQNMDVELAASTGRMQAIGQ